MMHVGAVALADEVEGAGPGLEHEGEILGAHGRRRVEIDMGVASDLAGYAGGEVGLRGMIDGRRVATPIFDPRRRATRRGDAVRDLVDSLFDHVASRRPE